MKSFIPKQPKQARERIEAKLAPAYPVVSANRCRRSCGSSREICQRGGLPEHPGRLAQPGRLRVAEMRTAVRLELAETTG